LKECLKPISATILLLIFSTVAFGQKLEPRKIITEPDHTIYSKIREKDYQLYISFPKDYSTKDTISYPVLYVLDGEYSINTIRGTRTILDAVNEIEDVIIVGISASPYASRYDDYTTSVDTSKDEQREEKYGLSKGRVKSGGAAKFLQSLKTEIIPFVDKNYKTNSDRGIFGHSFGGLFAAYCLVNSDGYFTRFGISSPSLWWDNEKLLNQAVTQFSDNETWDLPQTKVFISAGENDNKGILPTMVKYSKYLERSDYNNIDLKWQIFDDESHMSMWHVSISKSIQILYDQN
jgi:predicted alpha/beta superfamily hydrolase